MKLSIITPIYNTKKYLDRCIRSVLSQKVSDVEVVLVDDGSTDGSSDICDDYVANFPGVVSVIHKQQGGVSAARNSGLESVKGEYVFFVDSDDYVEDGFLKVLVEKLKTGADIYEFAFNVWRNDKLNRTHMPLVYETPMDVKKYLEESLERFTYEWFPWKYIFKKSLFADGVFFPVGLRYEDVYLLPRIMINAKTIVGMKEVGYNYILARPGAITNGINYNSETDKIKVCVSNIQFMNEHTDGRLKMLLNDSFSKMYISALIVVQGFESKDERKTMWKLLQSNVNILQYIKSGKQRFVSKFIKLFGLRAASTLLYLRYFLVRKNG